MLFRSALFLPATYLVAGLQKAMLLGARTWDPALEILVLAVWAILAFFISTQLFRWEPEERVTRNAKLWAVATVLPFLVLGVWESKYGKLPAQSKSIYDSAFSSGKTAPEAKPAEQAPQ